MTGETAERRTRQRVLEAGVTLLGRDGALTGDLVRRAAEAAGCHEERARVFFRRDEEMILALYARFAAALEARVADLPPGRLAARFRTIMEAKLALVAPYRDPLAALLAASLDPRHELGVLGDAAETIRTRVMAVFAAVALGATDAPADPATAAALGRALYGAHLGLLLLWTQDRSPDGRATRAALDLATNLLRLGGPLAKTPPVAAQLRQTDGAFGSLLAPAADPQVDATAEAVLRALFRHRRLAPDAGACAARPCARCLALHLPRVRRSVLRGDPVHLLLPAFPAKSPSPRKVLGVLPDKAEELALRYLENVCAEIANVYPPGARVTICSDGRVFSDLVGVTDADVTAYGAEIGRLIDALGLRSLDTFSMEDLYDPEDFDAMRAQLEAHYAEPLAEIVARAERSPQHRALFNGIHRFLVEEHPGADGLSKTKLREVCKPLAYEVIRRSDAWGRLLADCFPFALRLSIHPQDPHAEKIGILLGDSAADAWITPWHGAAVHRPDGIWTLMKREDAESLPGAHVVCDAAGRPSHIAVGGKA